MDVEGVTTIAALDMCEGGGDIDGRMVEMDGEAALNNTDQARDIDDTLTIIISTSGGTSLREPRERNEAGNIHYGERSVK